MMHAHLILILIIQSAPDFLVSILNISFKEIVQPKLLILTLFNHSHDVLNLFCGTIF